MFCFSGYGQGGVKLDLSEDGSSIKKAWFNQNLDSRMGGMVVVDGYIYGSGDRYREWRCINWDTGEETYVSKDIGKGVIIYADGMLYCYSYFGDFGLVKPTTNGFEVKGEFKLKKKRNLHISHPVIKDGRMYVRYANQLLVYSIANV